MRSQTPSRCTLIAVGFLRADVASDPSPLNSSFLLVVLLSDSFRVAFASLTLLRLAVGRAQLPLAETTAAAASGAPLAHVRLGSRLCRAASGSNQFVLQGATRSDRTWAAAVRFPFFLPGVGPGLCEFVLVRASVVGQPCGARIVSDLVALLVCAVLAEVSPHAYQSASQQHADRADRERCVPLSIV